jgi:hypothetical protein
MTEEPCRKKDDRDKDLPPEPALDDVEGWKALVKQRFEGRLKIREDEIKHFLINEIKVNPKIVKSIPVVPTGYYKKNPTPYRLNS